MEKGGQDPKRVDHTKPLLTEPDFACDLLKTHKTNTTVQKAPQVTCQESDNLIKHAKQHLMNFATRKERMTSAQKYND